MSIRPIDFNGMVQNTSELSVTHGQEEQKPVVQQEFVTVEIKQQAETSTTTVTKQDNVAENDSGYQGNRNRKGEKKSPKEKMPDGSVRVKSDHPSFNMTV